MGETFSTNGLRRLWLLLVGERGSEREREREGMSFCELDSMESLTK